MDQNERAIIDDLFAKLQEAERRAGPRDGDAEEAIRRHVEAQPAVPYYMAQAIVVQQEALKGAQGRIDDLERQLAERPAGGGFLSGLFGGGQSSAPPPARTVRPATARGPSGAPAGGGFLAGAAQTALGVAGGIMIADALGDMFGAGDATAAEAVPADEAAAVEPAEEATAEMAPEETAGVSPEDDGFDSDLGVDSDDMDFDF